MDSETGNHLQVLKGWCLSLKRVAGGREECREAVPTLGRLSLPTGSGQDVLPDDVPPAQTSLSFFSSPPRRESEALLTPSGKAQNEPKKKQDVCPKYTHAVGESLLEV